MRKVVFVCLLLGACTKNDDYPVGGGGGGGTGGTGGGGDAAVGGDGGASGKISGRVCAFTDLRTPGQPCGPGTFTVTLGVDMSTTHADGTFEIQQPLSSLLTWHVTASDVKIAMPFGASTTIPSITTTDYNQVATQNNATLVTGQGVVVSSVKRMGSVFQGVTATAPAPAVARYETGDALVWSTSGGTGINGTIWLPNVPIGRPDIVFSANGTTVTAEAVPVEDQGITFITVEFP